MSKVSKHIFTKSSRSRKPKFLSNSHFDSLYPIAARLLNYPIPLPLMQSNSF